MQKYVWYESIIAPFIHKSYGTLYDVIGCYQRCYDVIHPSKNDLAQQLHSNIRTTFISRNSITQKICNRKLVYMTICFSTAHCP